MAVLTIGDQFPAYELTGVVPGKLAEIEANKPEDYFTTVSSEGLDEDTWRVVFFWPKGLHLRLPHRNRRIRQARRRIRGTRLPGYRRIRG